MGKKRFYDAVRDLIRDVHDPPEQPPRAKRRLSISSLLAAPQTCAVCWDVVAAPVNPGLPLCCHHCLAVLCRQCLHAYASAGLADRSLLPLRCAQIECRAPVPLSALTRVLSSRDVARLARLQCDVVRRNEPLPNPSASRPHHLFSDPHRHRPRSPLPVIMRRRHQPNRKTRKQPTRNSGKHNNLRNDENTHPSEQEDGSESDRHQDNENEGETHDEDDRSLLELMAAQGWRRCPQCGMCIERTTGCPHMVCVCGAEFCYTCGEPWGPSGLGCPRRCGLPHGADELLTMLPGRFDQMREELWQRFTALLATFREHLERADDSRALPPPDRPVRGRPEGRLERPVKMRLRSLVHPSGENRLL